MASKLKTKVKALAKRAAVASKLRGLALARRSFGWRRRARRGLGLPARPYGVNLVGYVRAETGLGQAARGMAAALEAAGVPFGIVNFEEGNLAAHTNLAWKHKEVERPGFDVTLVCVNPDNADNLRATVPNALLGSRYVIGNWFWELSELPDAWTREFSLVNEVWAGSRFVERAIAARSPVPVVRIPPVVQLTRGKSLPRGYFGVPERRFLFLCVCDTMSVLERKNPLGAVRAFKRAFAPDDGRAALLVKFNNPGFRSTELESVLEEVRGAANIHTLERVLSREEMGALLETADCLVSLHRSEGFGLVPAEAMRLAKPALLTNWSGNTDYMTPDNSVGIGYELVSLGRDYGPYKSHQVWAEPDTEQAARWMRRLVEEPGLAQRIGARARETIEANYSPEAVGALIKKRLDDIRRDA
ncbi:MAG TPA: glycosyltransferase [Pyrinomonadaceae bacterium]|nr:glycosyltransferase [Pyrinomonadaceae bacterium]